MLYSGNTVKCVFSASCGVCRATAMGTSVQVIGSIAQDGDFWRHIQHRFIRPRLRWGGHRGTNDAAKSSHRHNGDGDKGGRGGVYAVTPQRVPGKRIASLSRACGDSVSAGWLEISSTEEERRRSAMNTKSQQKHARLGSPLEVLLAFAKLGVTCFGGPIAHIGYFREEFVVKRRWLDEPAYADLVALCQFLPGPASSQVGFSIGLMRAGYLGGLAAWTGFTLPSAIALVLFAYGAHSLGGPVGIGLLHGLKLVAVAIVAQAVWGMARTLCPDRERASIAVVAALIVLFLHTSSVSQIGAILAGALAGLWLCRSRPPALMGSIAVPVSRRVGFVSLVMFFLLLVGPPLLRGFTVSPGIALFDAFYRSGALVFGGGHVVL